MNDTILKLSIGGLMGVSESLCGGNFFESLKIMKQHNNGYKETIMILYKRNGLKTLFYTGYFPYGIFQSLTKGVPFFYASTTTRDYFLKNNMDKSNAYILSGFCGGLFQGIFIAPTQRIKSMSLVQHNFNPINFIKQEKFNIFKGAGLLSVRRSIDWSLRSFVMNKFNKSDSDTSIAISSFIGGMSSGLTIPIDVTIARIQTSNNNLINTIKIIYKENGIKSFYNGLGMRMFYSGWHTFWVMGVGNIIYNKIKIIKN